MDFRIHFCREDVPRQAGNDHAGTYTLLNKLRTNERDAPCGTTGVSVPSAISSHCGDLAITCSPVSAHKPRTFSFEKAVESNFTRSDLPS